MATTFGRATWPGVSNFISCRYTASHGTTPGQAELLCPLGDLPNIQQNGTLSIFDGNQGFDLRDCVVDSISLADGGGGKCLKLNILDRRWKWKYGTIGGLFNEQDEKGRYYFNFKTAKEITLELLKLMEEPNAVVDMPDNRTYAEMPEVEWNEVNAAQFLTNFADRYGRVVVFQPIQDRLLIVPPGSGQLLPNLDAMNISASVDTFEKPRSIQVLGAPVAFICAFVLEAVGEEPDGEIRPIDQLSYKPTGDRGWGQSRSRGFRNVTIAGQQVGGQQVLQGVMNRDELASLASRSVWKMYRIKLAYPTSTTTISTELGTTIQVDATRAWSVPGLGDLAPDLKIESIRQIDLLEGILHAGDDDVRSRPYFNPPFVVGSVSQNCRSREAVLRTLDLTKPTDALLEIGFSVDSERKLIVFDRHVYTKGGTVTVPLDVEPQLVLVTSVHVRDQDGRYVRYKKEVMIDENIRTQPMVLVRDEIELAKTAALSRDDWSASELKDNMATCDAIALHYLDATKARFQDLSGESRTYPGILPIDPDGAIREVTWSVGGLQPATTTVSRNTEHAYWQPPYEFRRNQIRTKSFVDKGLSPYG